MTFGSMPLWLRLIFSVVGPRLSGSTMGISFRLLEAAMNMERVIMRRAAALALPVVQVRLLVGRCHCCLTDVVFHTLF